MRLFTQIAAPLWNAFDPMPAKPRIYKHRGEWWVRCKWGDPTGPYANRSTAFDVARDIWQEPSRP